MKGVLRVCLAWSVLVGPLASPSAAEQLSLRSLAQLMMLTMDRNDDGKMNGHDWAIMNTKQRQESATMVVTFYSQQGYEQNGAAFDLEEDTELRRVVAHLSNRVYLRLDAFYKNKRNRAAGISEKGLTFLDLEKRSLGALVQ